MPKLPELTTSGQLLLFENPENPLIPQEAVPDTTPDVVDLERPVAQAVTTPDEDEREGVYTGLGGNAVEDSDDLARVLAGIGLGGRRARAALAREHGRNQDRMHGLTGRVVLSEAQQASRDAGLAQAHEVVDSLPRRRRYPRAA